MVRARKAGTSAAGALVSNPEKKRADAKKLPSKEFLTATKKNSTV
jgi:hypothetical protein